ncbi:MAG: hypothetical protein JXA06_03125 [Bacteroidetes bacterium]|nr:hypothetical protein [Bacteroidota bacterium]
MKAIKTILVLGILMTADYNISAAQSYAGSAAAVEPTMLVDRPTAGLLKRGSYSVSSGFFQRGGLLAGITVGIFEPFTFGISYGGTGIIGKDSIGMNPLPGMNAKLRILSEGVLIPALAVGFDSQGKEPYLKADSLKRYTIKSPGIYIVASKNYSILGNLSIHGGLNRSLEDGDGDKDLNMFIGVEKSLSDDISIMLEYDLAVNDNHGDAIGKGNGYLNFGFRWSWGKGLVVGFNLKNIIKNQDHVKVGNRTLQIDYIGEF